MEGYRNFSVASYMFAYYAAKATDEQIRKDMETYLRYLPLHKVYLENHRAQECDEMLMPFKDIIRLIPAES